MRIIQSSNIQLGKTFIGQGLLGNKLRAGLKVTFARIIELALSEQADLVILAGDTFDTTDVSQNLLNFFLTQVKRLEKIPVVILPGKSDPFHKGSFWDEWNIMRPLENLYTLSNREKSRIDIENISASIYGLPIIADSRAVNPFNRLEKSGKASHHIGVVYGSIAQGESDDDQEVTFQPTDIISSGFDYVALGGRATYRDYTDIGLKAAYSGSPEALAPGLDDAGHVLIVNINDDFLSVEPRKVGGFQWKDIKISMDTIVNLDDFKRKISNMAGPDTILKVTLQGLALLEAGIDIERIKYELEGDFLHLDLVDNSEVLPSNVSEVKVQEKTMLGQYLKIMVDKLSKADDTNRPVLEESLKTGYTLLTGKEIW